ncbi:MAG TPA: LPXTG cell wall anchor domain-containing protein [Acidimicrobiales bacterium]|nr:LPXTG cell wall anchor domain-containing protein [Acidimicrobiales bacterium]
MLSVVGITIVVAGTLGAPPANAEPSLTPTPRAVCDPGSIQEPGLQGRVPGDEIKAGRVKDGYRCNVDIVGHQGLSGGYKVERFIDKAGHECAYYDTTLLFPANASTIAQQPTGVAVLDMADPSKPKLTTSLETPAMQSPHESMSLNRTRGLLAAVAGNPFFAPGIVDVYDLNADCRAPVLKASAPVGILGHESGFAPDGKTFYAASVSGGTLTAIDITNPMTPMPIWEGSYNIHSLSISDDGNTAYLAGSPGYPRTELGLPSDFAGVLIFDVSQVQDRKVNPQVRLIGSVTWKSVSIPQNTIPVTIAGHPYLVETDEFSLDDKGRFVGNAPNVGAARIIDIADPTHPFVVSNMRLEVNQRENRAVVAGDPNATSSTQGYAAHYCNVPSRVDPGIVACSFINSGLRVFDIRDPLAPKEVAYFVPPLSPSSNTWAMSSPSLIPERREVWYSDANSGLWVLHLSASAWPSTAVVASSSDGSAAADTSSAAPAPAVAPTRRRTLPATGDTGGNGALMLGLSLAAIAIGLRTRRPSQRSDR